MDRTRQFMGRVSSETGGLMLDTSYSQVQKQLAVSAKRNRTQYSRVGLIGKDEVNSIQKQLIAASDGSGVKRVAVLPFFPLEQMNFDYGSPEVQIATEIRKLLKLLQNCGSPNHAKLKTN